ncbi:MAG: hypothetical protein FJ011_17920, partial [Chloroflexi bacterium]|nr:hypothetical protein [Chloroflexota bacterium]
MRQHLLTFAGFALIVMLITVSVVAAAPQAAGVGPQVAAPGPEAAVPAPDVAPDRLVAGQRPGVYYMDYGSTYMDPNVYPVRGAMRLFSWHDLQYSSNGFNWAKVTNWITARYNAELSTGIFVTTYDGLWNGDIRSAPDFVIETPGAMVVITDPSTAYINYMRYDNGNFESGDYLWTLSGAATVTDVGVPGGSKAAVLGGANLAADGVTHSAIRVPAMPPPADWPGGTKMEVWFDYYVQTSDATPNADHLYVELLDSSDTLLGQIADITNTSVATGTWTSLTLDASNYVKRDLKVRFRATNDASAPTTFY